MNDSWLRLYHRLPAAARSVAASLWGWRLRRWRVGPESPQLIDAALERETWSAERWRSFQEERLERILHRAATSVPFYRDYWQRRRRSGDRRGWDDLAGWPILTKEEVRRRPRAFLAEDCDPRRMFPEHTSGTTGTPLELWWSRDTVRAWFALFEARLRRWNGVDQETPWGMLGGQLVAPPHRRKPPFWVWNAPMRQLYLSAYHLSRDHLASYLAAIDAHGVRYLLGYASAMHTLASFALASGCDVPKLAVAISNGEPLYDHQRRTIGQAFGCPVRETFGMAELTCAASECAHGALHLWPEVGAVEILDGEDRPLAPGRSGRLVATGLLNADMPLIRYETGNRAALADEPADEGGCECGRTLPRLLAVEGRLDDVVRTPDGRRIGRLDPVFKAEVPILEAQVVQERLDRVRLRVVPAPGFEDRHGEQLIERLRQRLGQGIDVELEEVERIERAPGGKFRGVVSLTEPLEPDGASDPPEATGPRVLMITSEWPTDEAPYRAPFIVQQVDFLRRAGVAVEVLAFRGGGRVGNYLAAWRRVRAALKRGDFDVVHAQWGQSALPALFCRRPLVITFRGSDLEGLPHDDGRRTLGGRILRGWSRWAARRADQVVVVSARLARHLPRRDFHVIPSGLDRELFRPCSSAEARRELGLPTDRRLVLFAASPSNPIKRHALAKAAVEQLPSELEAGLLVVDAVPHERMPLYMNACDVLLLTSRHEGSPNVVKEALACCLPVVSVDVGDVGERIAGIDGCVLCEDDEPSTLAAALVEVLRRGRRLEPPAAIAELDEERLAEKMIAVYEEACRA